MVEYLRRGNRHVAYRLDGSGSTNILYFSGEPFSIELLDDEPHVAHLIRRLAGLGRLVQFDLPGLGLSDALSTDLSMESVVDDAVGILDALGIEEAVVIGANAGAAFAVPLATTAPNRVRALVLIDAQACVIWDEDYPLGIDEKIVRAYVEQVSDPNIEWTAAGMNSHKWMNPSLADDPHYKNWEARALRQGTTPAMAAAGLRLLAYADLRPHLPLITAPTLVLARRDNAFLPSAHSRYLAERIAGATVVELPGTDHVPYSGDTDALMDEVEEFLTGQRGSHADRVLTTIVFTDIVGSTPLATELGDRAWRTLLDAHDAIVRAVFARHGGRVVNTTGDGFVGAFESPTRAVEASRAIIVAAADAGVVVRIGIHTGECERRGEDLAGLSVHIAARVGALAGAHEVLVSRTVCDVLAGSSLRFLPRGEHPLKGVQKRWELFALADTAP
jgi:class 3 adenylate cyclase